MAAQGASRTGSERMWRDASVKPAAAAFVPSWYDVNAAEPYDVLL